MSPQTVPFVQLVKMIERELEFARARQLADLQLAVEQTGAFIATLPVPAPTSARPLIHHASGLRNRVEIETRGIRDEIARGRVAVKRARRVTRTYVQRPDSRYSTSV